jgi:hypothetical protein
MELKIGLMEELEEHMPETTKFHSGTLKEDSLPNTGFIVKMIFMQCTGPMPHVRKEIMLWCDSRDCDKDLPKTKRRKTSDTMTKHEETEQRVLEIAEELREMHENSLKLGEVHYRLWARMLVTCHGVHSSKENPPQVPVITGSTPRRQVSQEKDLRRVLLVQLLRWSKELPRILHIPLLQFNHHKLT